MRKFVSLALALSTAAALAGCNASGGFDLGDPAASQQALADPSAANVQPPGDAIGRAKKAFRTRSFGLAEKGFREAVEKSPNDAEAWLGLAATHDQLGRFDLADKEYAQVQRKGGAAFELLNNRGYSYMLRGDLARARKDFTAAQRLEPDNEFVRNNLRELDEKAAGRG